MSLKAFQQSFERRWGGWLNRCFYAQNDQRVWMPVSGRVPRAYLCKVCGFHPSDWDDYVSETKRSDGRMWRSISCWNGETAIARLRAALLIDHAHELRKRRPEARHGAQARIGATAFLVARALQGRGNA